MRSGTIAMFDALGFKGIWNRPEYRNNPEIVIEKLHSLSKETEYLMNLYFGDEQGRSLKIQENNILEFAGISFLSDTIVIGVSLKPIEALKDIIDSKDVDDVFLTAVTTLVCCNIASDVLVAAARSTPVLSYRGCVATAQFEMDERFILGPAVDEAAYGMDLAQAAIVWLAPSAEASYRQSKIDSDQVNRSVLIPYTVPLKGGDVYETYAVSPFRQVIVQEERTQLIGNIVQTLFSDSFPLDVAVKMQQTARFLMECDKSATNVLEAEYETPSE